MLLPEPPFLCALSTTDEESPSAVEILQQMFVVKLLTLKNHRNSTPLDHGELGVAGL